MKIDNKKKKIIIIAAVIILVAAIATTVGVLCSKKSSDSDDSQTQTVMVEVTDENGEAVTNADGEIVTKAEEVKNKSNGDKKTSADGKNNNNNSGNNNSNKKDESTTEPLTEYTTKSPLDANMGYDQLLDDDLILTPRNGLLALQEYYGDKYVVNLGDNDWTSNDIYYVIFVKNEKKTDIAYRIVVNMETGKAIQTDENNKTEDITEPLKEFYW